MSFYAKFFVDGGQPEGYEVVAAGVAFGQTTDDKGRPNSTVYGSYIVVRVVDTSETELLKWMLDAWDRRNGKIQFFRNDQASVYKEISFTNGYCTDYVADMMPGQQLASLTDTIYISPESTTVNGATHTNIW